MDTDQPISDALPEARSKRPNLRLRTLLVLAAVFVGLYVFVRLDRSVAERFGPIVLGVHDLFNQVPGKPTPLSETGKRFVADLKALGGDPIVSVLNPGFLGYFGRGESFSIASHQRSFDDAALARLAELHGDRIMGLYLQNTAVTDDGLKHLSKFTKLRNLEIRNFDRRSRPPTITDAGIAHLKGLTKLTSLDLGESTVTDTGLESIKDLPELMSLYLDNTEVTGTGLAKLKSLTRLSLLSLNGCQLNQEGLKALAGATNLGILSLDRTPLDAGALPPLKAIPALKELDITGCGFLDEEVADLKKSRPGLRIMRR